MCLSSFCAVWRSGKTQCRRTAYANKQPRGNNVFHTRAHLFSFPKQRDHETPLAVKAFGSSLHAEQTVKSLNDVKALSNLSPRPLPHLLHHCKCSATCIPASPPTLPEADPQIALLLSDLFTQRSLILQNRCQNSTQSPRLVPSPTSG